MKVEVTISGAATELSRLTLVVVARSKVIKLSSISEILMNSDRLSMMIWLVTVQEPNVSVMCARGSIVIRRITECVERSFLVPSYETIPH